MLDYLAIFYGAGATDARIRQAKKQNLKNKQKGKNQQRHKNAQKVNRKERRRKKKSNKRLTKETKGFGENDKDTDAVIGDLKGVLN